MSTNQVAVKFTVKAIKETLAGDISTKNSKMPGSTFGLSTAGCSVGSKLRNVCGSVCEKCYAAKLEKIRPSVKQGWQNRTDKVVETIQAGPDAMWHWSAAIAQRINQVADKTGEPFHRWHDSGDLQGVEHLRMIAHAAALTPNVKHWLPTKEKAVVKRYLKTFGSFPDNLTVRVSAAMVGSEPTSADLTSTVHRKGETAHGHECPAYKQGGNCGDCRACWDATVENVSYPLH